MQFNSTSADHGCGVTCGCLIILLILNLTLGAVCVQYDLYSLWGAELPWYGNVGIGLVAGEVAVPIAIVCWIVRQCGVDAPFWPRQLAHGN